MYSVHVGRNQPCPCGSGKKHKRCCGNPLKEPAIASSQYSSRTIPAEIMTIFERRKADELIREQQQGFGRPIVSMKLGDRKIVVAGDTIYQSTKWQTISDFLGDYIKMILGSDWGKSELQKPSVDRHPILQWYHEYCTFQQKGLGLAKDLGKPAKIKSVKMTGVVYCYIGLAYGLYLLKHNVELQERLIKRLKDTRQFQGAYYEVMVANILIRAGFELTLEDETDETTKHCEFAAISKKTGKKYWIEAKTRSELGVLGKTKQDGSTNKDVTSQLSKHINAALQKPAQDERMIFVDVNADPSPHGIIPAWSAQAGRRLDAKEKCMQPSQTAYVFVTNTPYHRALQNDNIATCMMGFGLGMPDFGKEGHFRLSEIHRQRIKHQDAFAVIKSFQKYPQIPPTFDGSLPSTISGKPYDRILIGETYLFNDMKDNQGNPMQDLLGTVTSGTVSVSEKKMYICVLEINGQRSVILTYPMTDEAITDYNAHPEAFFGRVQHIGKKIEEPYETFLFFFDSYHNTPKEKLLEFMKSSLEMDRLELMSQEELAIEYCDLMASHFLRAK